MKTLLLTTLLLLVAGSAYSHPSNQDGLEFIGQGTTLHFTKELNIPGGKYTLYFAPLLYTDLTKSWEYKVGSTCFLVINPTSYDRKISSGRQVTVDKITPQSTILKHKNSFATSDVLQREYILELSGIEDIQSIICYKVNLYHKYNDSDIELTIREFTEHLKTIGVELSFPDPIEM